MIGETILHYKITEKLGEGGMGVVYKAEDTKLKRDVAIKLLPRQISTSEEEHARFKIEAQAAAALNHPNIATIHAIEEVDDERFIVMEYIEGQELKNLAKVENLRKVLDYATQIASGLQAAHEKGITHRDIKSANIMVTDKGVIKIMDFGLAKLSNRSKMTVQGTTLGTAAYMSPEQAQGAEIDHRSDIWSLGVVLYEMLSGQLPFKGDYEQAVIYSILHQEPEPLTALRSGLPIALDGIIAKALSKDPNTRYQHVDELPADLKAIDTASGSRSRISTVTQPFEGSKPSKGSKLPKTLIPWAISAVALIITSIVFLTRESPEPALPMTASLIFEKDAGPAVDRHMALSPDATRLAYVTSTVFDGARLWILDLADGSSRPLPGTDGAELPFWSPDGSMLGYFAKQKLRVVPANGGSPIELAPAPRPFGGAWNARGIILYSPSSGPLFQIPAAGGTPTQVTQLSRENEKHVGPVFLPDGRHFLFNTMGTGRYIHKGDLSTGEIEPIRDGADPMYVESGFLVFWRGGVFAQPFDPEHATPSGQPLPVLSGVMTPWGRAAMSVTNRLIAFVPQNQGQSREPPLLMSRTGDVLDSLAHREGGWVRRFSHDGKRVAIAGWKLWVHELARKVSEPVPTEKSWPFEFAWSPDDSRIVYFADATRQLRVVSVAGTIKEKVILQSARGDIVSPEWSPDGRTILFVYRADETRPHQELWACDVEKGTASQVLEGSFNVFDARFAPNGRWYAYTSDEGRNSSDVYLRQFPDTGAKRRVSVGGGAWPHWREDGKELFYLNGDGRLVAVQVEFDGGLSVSQAEVITADPITSSPYSRALSFDVHPDGQRFLKWQPATVLRLTILRDWVGMLEQRM